MVRLIFWGQRFREAGKRRGKGDGRPTAPVDMCRQGPFPVARPPSMGSCLDVEVPSCRGREAAVPRTTDPVVCAGATRCDRALDGRPGGRVGSEIGSHRTRREVTPIIGLDHRPHDESHMHPGAADVGAPGASGLRDAVEAWCAPQSGDGDLRGGQWSGAEVGIRCRGAGEQWCRWRLAHRVRRRIARSPASRYREPGSGPPRPFAFTIGSLDGLRRGRQWVATPPCGVEQEKSDVVHQPRPPRVDAR